MIFWIAMVFIFLGLLLIALTLIMSMGLMMTSQAFGAGRSEEMQRHNDPNRKGVVGNIVKVLLAGLVLTAIGFALMALGGA